MEKEMEETNVKLRRPGEVARFLRHFETADRHEVTNALLLLGLHYYRETTDGTFNLQTLQSATQRVRPSSQARRGEERNESYERSPQREQAFPVPSSNPPVTVQQRHQYLPRVFGPQHRATTSPNQHRAPPYHVEERVKDLLYGRERESEDSKRMQRTRQIYLFGGDVGGGGGNRPMTFGEQQNFSTATSGSRHAAAFERSYSAPSSAKRRQDQQQSRGRGGEERRRVIQCEPNYLRPTSAAKEKQRAPIDFSQPHGNKEERNNKKPWATQRRQADPYPSYDTVRVSRFLPHTRNRTHSADASREQHHNHQQQQQQRQREDELTQRRAQQQEEDEGNLVKYIMSKREKLREERQEMGGVAEADKDEVIEIPTFTRWKKKPNNTNNNNKRMTAVSSQGQSISHPIDVQSPTPNQQQQQQQSSVSNSSPLEIIDERERCPTDDKKAATIFDVVPKTTAETINSPPVGTNESPRKYEREEMNILEQQNQQPNQKPQQCTCTSTKAYPTVINGNGGETTILVPPPDVERTGKFVDPAPGEGLDSSSKVANNNNNKGSGSRNKGGKHGQQRQQVEAGSAAVREHENGETLEKRPPRKPRKLAGAAATNGTKEGDAGGPWTIMDAKFEGKPHRHHQQQQQRNSSQQMQQLEEGEKNEQRDHREKEEEKNEEEDDGPPKITTIPGWYSSSGEFNTPDGSKAKTAVLPKENHGPSGPGQHLSPGAAAPGWNSSSGEFNTPVENTGSSGDKAGKQPKGKHGLSAGNSHLAAGAGAGGWYSSSGEFTSSSPGVNNLPATVQSHSTGAHTSDPSSEDFPLEVDTNFSSLPTPQNLLGGALGQLPASGSPTVSDTSGNATPRAEGMILRRPSRAEIQTKKPSTSKPASYLHMLPVLVEESRQSDRLSSEGETICDSNKGSDGPPPTLNEKSASAAAATHSAEISQVSSSEDQQQQDSAFHTPKGRSPLNHSQVHLMYPPALVIKLRQLIEETKGAKLTQMQLCLALPGFEPSVIDPNFQDLYNCLLINYLLS